MTKEGLEKEAEEYLENNYCKNVCTRAENKHCKSGLQVRCCSFNEKKKFILSFAEPREKRIEELEQKLEQTEKDLTDYQFNYPKIKELKQENALLKGRNEGFEQQIMGLLIKYEEVYKRFPDLKSAMDKAKEILKENAELKEINEGYNRNRDKLIAMGFPTFKSCKEYSDKLTNLQKENARLKKEYSDNLSLKDEELMCLETEFNTYKSEAKELIKNLMVTPDECTSWYDLCDKAEQFLKE